MYYDDITGLAGNTPMVKIRGFDTGLCELFVKLENQNPGGSIKDRIGISMIRDAESDGRLGAHQKRLVEATAGNTGLALALIAARRQYHLTLVIPDKMSQEKIFHIKALGAEMVITRSDVSKGHPDYYQDLAVRIAAETGAFYVNQFENPSNPRTHETETGPEMAEQMQMNIDAVVCGVGSGGTITGLSRYFKKAIPKCEMVLADPKGSVLAEYIKTGKVGLAGSWVVEGIGEDFVPNICDLSRVNTAYTIDDLESLQTARYLLQKEGIFGGSSSGTLLAAALRYCKEQTTPKRVVTFICDSGNKYLSKMYNDFWLFDQGFIEEKKHGDLRDLVSRRATEKAVIFVEPKDSLLVAYLRMKQHDVSQLPVMKSGSIVGLVDESDLLNSVLEKGASFQAHVCDVMSSNLVTVRPGTKIGDLISLYAAGLVPIVMDGETFVGMITKIDLLTYLRKTSV